MAFRELARRCGSRVQTVMRPGRQHTRAFAEEYTGKHLSEKEKAAENIYIKKLEEEQKLKQARKAAAEAAKGTETGTPSSQGPGQTAADGFRNTAVFAGLIAVVAGYWLWSSSSKKEEKDIN